MFLLLRLFKPLRLLLLLLLVLLLVLLLLLLLLLLLGTDSGRGSSDLCCRCLRALTFFSLAERLFGRHCDSRHKIQESLAVFLRRLR